MREGAYNLGDALSSLIRILLSESKNFCYSIAVLTEIWLFPKPGGVINLGLIKRIASETSFVGEITHGVPYS